MNPPAALVCRELRLRNYRNFETLDLEFPPAGVAIIGENGAGKTNLLEAIYYLEIFRSFRGANDEQLVRFGGEAFHVRGRFEVDGGGSDAEITAAYETKSRRKRVTTNGAEPERIGDALGRIGVVVFSPSDVTIVAGGPGERRRFLDIVLSLHVPGYLHALQRYRQALRQRNSMLRRGTSAALLEAWNEPLLGAAARITAARAQWVREHAERFRELYAAIGGNAPATLRYDPGGRVDADALADEATSHAALVAEMARVAERERERGVTLVGPHRDDLTLLLDGAHGDVDLRGFGSGGQVRTGVIALRLLEAETIRATHGGRPPIVLLDDVFAELDPGRSRRILELLEADRHGQVILTAPKATDVELRRAGGVISSLAPWRITAGKVET